jgi:hypothetical protein
VAGAAQEASAAVVTAFGVHVVQRGPAARAGEGSARGPLGGDGPGQDGEDEAQGGRGGGGGGHHGCTCGCARRSDLQLI